MADPFTVKVGARGYEVDSNGHIIVDKSRHFYDDQWTDPASFIQLADAQTRPAP